MIEHDMDTALDMAERITCALRRVIVRGPGPRGRRPEDREVYLGH